MQRIPVGGRPERVNRQDAPRSRRDGIFDKSGVYGASVGTHVDKDRGSAAVEDGMAGSRKAVVGYQHFIARSYPKSCEREMETGRTVV